MDPLALNTFVAVYLSLSKRTGKSPVNQRLTGLVLVGGAGFEPATPAV